MRPNTVTCDKLLVGFTLLGLHKKGNFVLRPNKELVFFKEINELDRFHLLSDRYTSVIFRRTTWTCDGRCKHRVTELEMPLRLRLQRTKEGGRAKSILILLNQLSITSECCEGRGTLLCPSAHRHLSFLRCNSAGARHSDPNGGATP